MSKSFALDFKGYWVQSKIGYLPAHSGIYLVYVGTENLNGNVTLRKLIYVGESENVRERIGGHERMSDWQRHLRYGEVLIFSTAAIATDRERAEAAVINHHKPAENTEYVDSFPYSLTYVTVGGAAAHLTPTFVAN